MDMNKDLKFGIAGMGSIAAFHIKSIEELPGCRLQAVASSDPARARAGGQQYGVPAYTDVAEMLAKEPIDVLCICSASGNHLEPALAAAQAGVHVITEKPLEINLDRADRMIAACREAGVKLACIFQNRFKPDYQKVKAAVSSGKLGNIVLANAYIKWYRDEAYYASRPWRGTLQGDGGAALINQSIHTLDLLIDLMGSPTKVYGQIDTLTHQIEGEDLGLAIVSFESGAYGTIEGSTAIYPGYPERLEIHGSAGSIVLEGGKILHWQIQGEASAPSLPPTAQDTGASDPLAIDYRYHKAQIQDMVAAIHENREPLINGEEGRKVLALIMGIYASSQQDAPVYL